jgi:hypothetical protein
MTRWIPRLLVTCAVLGWASSPASAQAKRPVDSKSAAPATVQQVWAKTVEAFAGGLVKGDLGAVGALLAPRTTIRQFDGVADEELWRVFERITNGSLVGQHAYIHPPLVMATDLAVDFKTSKTVSDRAKTRFIVDDDGEMKRANATAVQWLELQLDAKYGALVGIVVLWVQRPAAADAPAVQEPVFVLLKGEEVSPGKVKVRTVLYGMPISADGHP